MSIDAHQPPVGQTREDMKEEAPKSSLSEISTLRIVALMIFPKMEDKKYIHMCPSSLMKCSFDLHPAMNPALDKYDVVKSLTLCPSPFQVKGDPLLVNPPIFYTPMTNPTSLVVWYIRGGNNPSFRRNFRDLMRTHKTLW
ncbi:hypothetical protein EJD97_014989 [Solanum chilense]|uniref:Uncharacterized protein n=1 Tax=Solanum chilense TaxID=4083 RepID=A0A6N2B7T3_SOLCI|nr:hypothetical protein EJD97_014989 [Solanum chilense]